jgi:hypothetical protein
MPAREAALSAAGRHRNRADLQSKHAETGAPLDRHPTARTAPHGRPEIATSNSTGSDVGSGPSARNGRPVVLGAEPDGRNNSGSARPVAVLESAQAPCFPFGNERILLNWPGPDSRVQSIEITLQLVHRHILVQQDRARVPIYQQPLPTMARPTAIASKCTSGNPAIAGSSDHRRRRHLPRTGSLLLKMGIFGVAIAIAAWLQLYNWDPAAPGSGYPGGTIPAPLSKQMGFDANTPRPTGAFAQPVRRTSNLGGASGLASR